MRGRSPAPGRLARLLAWRPYYLRTTIVLVTLTLACAATSAVMFLRGGTIEDGWPILLAVVAGFLVVPTALVIRDDGFGTWSGGGRDHSPYVVDTTPVHHD